MEIRFLDFWDQIAADGTPSVSKEHPRIASSTASDVSKYLQAAPYVDRTTALSRDEIDGTDAIVPQSLRSDGRWVWSDEVAYYVDKYLLSPGEDFLQYLSTNPTPPETLSDEQRAAILSHLRR